MLSESIIRDYLCSGERVVATFVMHAWLHNLGEVDSITQSPIMNEHRPVVAVLVVTPEGSLHVRFFPGETGHENYVFGSLVQALKHVGVFTKTPSMFGGFEYAKFQLCAGTAGRWRRMEVLVEDMKKMLVYFEGVVAEKRFDGWREVRNG